MIDVPHLLMCSTIYIIRTYYAHPSVCSMNMSTIHLQAQMPLSLCWKILISSSRSVSLLILWDYLYKLNSSMHTSLGLLLPCGITRELSRQLVLQCAGTKLKGLQRLADIAKSGYKWSLQDLQWLKKPATCSALCKDELIALLISHISTDCWYIT